MRFARWGVGFQITTVVLRSCKMKGTALHVGLVCCNALKKPFNWELMMTEDFDYPQPPKGFSRFLYRLPILIYQIGFGFLLGKRFLLLEHIGRKSALLRHAVLEVIRYDAIEQAYYVVSGFGSHSDWYLNISKNPEVRIQVGRKWMGACAETLPQDHAVREILGYAERYPRTFRVLAERLLGVHIGDSKEDLVQLARGFIVVRIGVKLGNGENKESVGS
jgi:deazaflavin-dependent oxidoreductase (nitroreductase family)